MRRWTSILVVCCIAFASVPAIAAVPFKGLQYSPQGGCTLDALTDGLLILRNIGSSGQDGVSVSLLHMDGMRMALDGDCTAADAGASCTISTHWTVVSQPASSKSATLTVSATPGGSATLLTITPVDDLDGLTSASTQTVLLSRAGVVVYRATVPSGTVARVAMDATGACPMPTLYCTVERKVHGLHRGSSFARVVHVTVDTHDEDCDDVDFVSAIDPADYNCDGSSGELRVTSPPGSSFSTVHCSSGACLFFDHYEQGTGVGQLSVAVDASGRRRLEVHNLGSSGQDGVSLKRAPSMGGGGGGGGCAAALVFASPSLHFDPLLDQGSSCVITVSGSSFAGAGLPPTPMSSSMTVRWHGTDFEGIADHSGMGADVESVVVFRHGLEVGRCAAPPGAALRFAPPPGGSPDCRVSSMGLSRGSYDLAVAKKSPMDVVYGAEPAGVTSASGKGLNAVNVRRAFQLDFDRDRVVLFGGSSLTGDRVYIYGGCASGTCGCSAGTCSYSGDFLIDNLRCRVTCLNPSSSLSTMSLLDIADASSADVVAAQVPSSTSLSGSNTCVRVPFTFERTDVTGVRGFSVSFHISPELSVCGSGVLQGDYLSRVAGTQMYVTGQGGGRYTVDCGILGGVCGATGSGTLFTLDVAAASSSPGTTPPDGTGEIVVDAVTMRDCSNGPVPADEGSPAFLPVDFTPPAALSSLTAVQRKSGNGTGGTTAITVSWAPAEPLASVLLFRKGFGGYPLYDDASGAAPTPPASPSDAVSTGWTLVSSPMGSTSSVDAQQPRDYLYYSAFSEDAAGNTSPVSNMTTGTLDYHLGDVSNGHVIGLGDNTVDLADVSLLGSHYGVTLATPSPFAYLDVGPTTDFTVDGRPLTDHHVDFEDFMMFAINFSVVSAPQAGAQPASLAANATRLVVPALPAPGATFDAVLEMDGAGDVQGLSAKLDYDHAILEQEGVAPGALLGAQGRQSAVLSSGPGDVDAALLGVGPGIAGRGELATVTFLVKAAGDPRLGIADVVARDAHNRQVTIAAAVGGPVTVARPGLGLAAPNPFHEMTVLALGLGSAGPVRVAVYDVAGRRVRTLLDGVQRAGLHTIRWDGRDDSGLQMAPGAYVVRYAAEGRNESRTVRLVR